MVPTTTMMSHVYSTALSAGVFTRVRGDATFLTQSIDPEHRMWVGKCWLRSQEDKPRSCPTKMWDGIVRLVCNSNLSTVIRCWWDNSWSIRTILGDFHTKGPWMSQQFLASEQKQEPSMCRISNYSFSYFSSLVLDFQDLFLRLRHILFSESSKEICMNHDPLKYLDRFSPNT